MSTGELHDSSSTEKSSTRTESLGTLVSTPGTPSTIVTSCSIPSSASFSPPLGHAANINEDDFFGGNSFLDGDDDSDGYHRYDVDDDSFEIDYRGHYVEKKEPQDPIVRMALHASQKTLQPGIESSSTFFSTGQKKFNEKSTSESLDQIGNEFFEQGKLDQAFEKYEEALQLKRHCLLGQYNAMEPSGVSEEERARILASMATSINNLAYLRQVKGRASAEETLASYEMALLIKREILGPDHMSVGKTLNNIGSVHYVERNYHEAAASYEQARDIMRLHLGSDHLDICTVTTNLGDVHYSMRQWTLAVKEYRTALELRWNVLGSKDPKVVRLMEQIAELEMMIDKMNTSKDENVGRADRFYGPTLRDVHKLQQEVRQDLKHFDFLECQMPIEMIKDKILVFKELREMKGEDDNKDVIVSLQHTASALLPNDLVRLEMGAALVQSVKPQSPSPSADSLSSEAPESGFVCEFVAEATLPFAESDLGETTPVALSSPPMPSCCVSSSDRSPAAPPRFVNSACPPLTSEDRQLALASVRERLARLRADRDIEENIPPLIRATDVKELCLSPHMKIPPRETTQASSPSILLMTSELLTMKQGINSLRGLSNKSSPVERNTTTSAHRQTRLRPIKASSKISQIRIVTSTRKAAASRINSARNSAMIR